jgi:hypothetical protein
VKFLYPFLFFCLTLHSIAQDSTRVVWGGELSGALEKGNQFNSKKIGFVGAVNTQGLVIRKSNEFRWNVVLAYMQLPNFITRNLDSTGVIPFFHKPIYASGEGGALVILPELAYEKSLGKYFSVKIANERIHVGPGYRSLIFSNQAGALPQLGLRTEFGKFKFYNSWARTEHYDSNLNLKKAKYLAMHGLKWTFNSRWYAEITEMVTWQAKDSASNRGLDMHYLNPFLFYRPVEYAQGSADNVLMSAQVHFQPSENFRVYGQFLLDEFLLKEVRNRSGWWGNKFGGMIGMNAVSRKTPGLSYQSEWSFARPYTYTHGSEAQAWGHWNTPFAHPLGANFYEWWQRVQVAKDKWKYDVVGVWAAYGRDPNYNVGGNIFQSYKAPWQQYNNFILQGVRSTLLVLDARVSYQINENWKIAANLRWRSVRSRVNPFDEQWVTIGIRRGLDFPMRWDF